MWLFLAVIRKRRLKVKADFLRNELYYNKSNKNIGIKMVQECKLRFGQMTLSENDK